MKRAYPGGTAGSHETDPVADVEDKSADSGVAGPSGLEHGAGLELGVEADSTGETAPKLAKVGTESGHGELAGLEQLELAVAAASGEVEGGQATDQEVLLVEAIQTAPEEAQLGNEALGGDGEAGLEAQGLAVQEEAGKEETNSINNNHENNINNNEDTQVVLATAAVDEDGHCQIALPGDAITDQENTIVAQPAGVVVNVTEWVADHTVDEGVCPDEDEVASGEASLMDNEWLEEGDGTWPPIWTREMWLERRAKHHWLSARENRLGCRYCLRVKYMGTSAGDFTDMSSEWVSYAIAYSGETREQQLKSLRNKIQRHEVSKVHVKAEELINNSKNNPPMRNQVTQTLNKQVQMTSSIFKDIYSFVKQSVDVQALEATFRANLKYKPYREFATYQEFEVVSVIEHIAEQMRTALVREVTGHKFPLAVVVDHIEGFLPSAQTVFLIFLRIRSESGGGLKNVFWDAVPYPSAADPSMAPMPVISQSLLDGGFTVDFLSQRLMCFVTDPLGSHLGAESNLCHQLALSFDKIVIWYVLAYRLEEMVLAAMKKLGAPNYLAQLYDTLYSLMQLSERNVQELLINTPAVYEQVLRVGQLLRPADVASSFKAVSAITQSYLILYMYMVQAGNDGTRTEAEKRKYSFAKGLMESEQFVRELALVYDVLKLLHETRCQVDNADCDMARADSILVQAMEGLMSLSQQPGAFEAAAITELQPGASRSFLSVGPLVDNPLLQSLNRTAFMECIVELSRQNMISISGLAENLVENFIRDLHTINLANWPPNPPVTFADDSVNRLCSVFELESREAAIRDTFQNFVRSGCQPTEVPPEMALLQSHANVFPCSSELCAEVVEKVNKVKPARSPEQVRSLAAALFVHVNGEERFAPLPLVRMWCVKHPLVSESKTAKKRKNLEEEVWSPVGSRAEEVILERQDEDSFVAVLHE